MMVLWGILIKSKVFLYIFIIGDIRLYGIELVLVFLEVKSIIIFFFFGWFLYFMG